MRAMARMAKAPFAWLAGGGYDDVEEFDDVEETAPVVTEFEKKQEAAEAQARAVTRYAAASLLDDLPAPLPPDLTPALKEWCRGLSREECIEICGARPEAVSSHIQCVFLLPSVRKVSALPTTEWPREPLPGWGNGSPHFLSSAYAI